MDLENFYVTPCLNNKIPKVSVQRDRERQIGTPIFNKKNFRQKKLKKIPRYQVTGLGYPVALLEGFPSKVPSRNSTEQLVWCLTHMWSILHIISVICYLIHICVSTSYYSELVVGLEVWFWTLLEVWGGWKLGC